MKLPIWLDAHFASDINALRRYGLAVCEHVWRLQGPCAGTCRRCGIAKPTDLETFWDDAEALAEHGETAP